MAAVEAAAVRAMPRLRLHPEAVVVAELHVLSGHIKRPRFTRRRMWLSEALELPVPQPVQMTRQGQMVALAEHRVLAERRVVP